MPLGVAFATRRACAAQALLRHLPAPVRRRARSRPSPAAAPARRRAPRPPRFPPAPTTTPPRTPPSPSPTPPPPPAATAAGRSPPPRSAPCYTRPSLRAQGPGTPTSTPTSPPAAAAAAARPSSSSSSQQLLFRVNVRTSLGGLTDIHPGATLRRQYLWQQHQSHSLEGRPSGGLPLLRAADSLELANARLSKPPAAAAAQPCVLLHSVDSGDCAAPAAGEAAQPEEREGWRAQVRAPPNAAAHTAAAALAGAQQPQRVAPLPSGGCTVSQEVEVTLNHNTLLLAAAAASGALPPHAGPASLCLGSAALPTSPPPANRAPPPGHSTPSTPRGGGEPSPPAHVTVDVPVPPSKGGGAAPLLPAAAGGSPGAAPSGHLHRMGKMTEVRGGCAACTLRGAVQRRRPASRNEPHVRGPLSCRCPTCLPAQTWIAMELCEGGSMSAALAAGAYRLPAAAAAAATPLAAHAALAGTAAGPPSPAATVAAAGSSGAGSEEDPDGAPAPDVNIVSRAVLLTYAVHWGKRARHGATAEVPPRVRCCFLACRCRWRCCSTRATWRRAWPTCTRAASSTAVRARRASRQRRCVMPRNTLTGRAQTCKRVPADLKMDNVMLQRKAAGAPHAAAAKPPPPPPSSHSPAKRAAMLLLGAGGAVREEQEPFAGGGGSGEVLGVQSSAVSAAFDGPHVAKDYVAKVRGGASWAPCVRCWRAAHPPPRHRRARDQGGNHWQQPRQSAGDV